MSLGTSGSSSSRRRTTSRTDREKTGADLRLSVASLMSALPFGAALAMRVGPRQPDDEREPSGEQTDAEREVAGHARGHGIARASMWPVQIGRASCRERVEVAEVGGTLRRQE